MRTYRLDVALLDEVADQPRFLRWRIAQVGIPIEPEPHQLRDSLMAIGVGLNSWETCGPDESGIIEIFEDGIRAARLVPEDGERVTGGLSDDLCVPVGR